MAVSQSVVDTADCACWSSAANSGVALPLGTNGNVVAVSVTSDAGVSVAVGIGVTVGTLMAVAVCTISATPGTAGVSVSK